MSPCWLLSKKNFEKTEKMMKSTRAEQRESENEEEINDY